MSLRFRRLIYMSFIVAFIVIAPVITSYATGYRYNFKKNKIEKTGIAIIESDPKKTDVYIDGKYKDETPVKFSRLLPDVYHFEVKKDGYHSWSKELEIKSNQTTFATDIVLFKDTLPISTIEGRVNIFSISKDKNFIVYSLIKEDIEELRLLNIKNNADFLIDELNLNSYNNLKEVSWSDNTNKLLLAQTIGEFNKYIVVDVQSLKTKELFDITRTNYDKVSWGNDDNLYGLRQAVLHKINLTTSSTQILLSANITDFKIYNNSVYFIEKLANELFFNKAILEDNEVVETQKIKLPSAGEFTISSIQNDLITLIDTKNKNLFLLKERVFSDNKIEGNLVFQANASHAMWDNKNEKLLFTNDFELNYYELATNNRVLITRLGEEIKDAFWYTGNNYIIYLTTNTIKTIEAKDTEEKNDLVLASLPVIKKIAPGGLGNFVYFVGRAGSIEGIYKLEIN